MIGKYGFIADLIEPDQYLFGSQKLTGEVLQKDGQWGDFLPEIELQRLYGVETMSCVTFTILNCMETQIRRKYGLEPNYAERFTAILGATTPAGASPQIVSEGVRKKGVVPQSLLPFDQSIKSFDDFHSPNPMHKHLLEVGEQFLEHFSFGHDWVFTKGADVEKLKDALQYSPLLVSVDAWRMKDDLYVKEKGARDNHATMLYGYEEGKFWKIFDSYDNTLKKLAWDYDFTFAKRFVVERKSEVPEDELQGIIGWFFDTCISLWRKLMGVLGF